MERIFWYQHLQYSKSVDAHTCLYMVQNLDCKGDKIIKNGKIATFNQEPIGDGAWWSIKEYSISNWIVSAIKSLFRDLTSDPLPENASINHGI